MEQFDDHAYLSLYCLACDRILERGRRDWETGTKFEYLGQGSLLPDA